MSGTKPDKVEYYVEQIAVLGISKNCNVDAPLADAIQLSVCGDENTLSAFVDIRFHGCV